MFKKVLPIPYWFKKNYIRLDFENVKVLKIITIINKIDFAYEKSSVQVFFSKMRLLLFCCFELLFAHSCDNKGEEPMKIHAHGCF